MKTTITPKMKLKLEAFTHDHLTPIYRSGAYGERMLKELSPWWMKQLDDSQASRSLVPVLLEAEQKYAERMSYPKSLFKADIFKEECLGVGATRTKVADRGDDVETRERMFKTELKTGLVPFELTGSVRTKSSGAPDFIAKKDWFANSDKQHFLDELSRTLKRGRVETALDMVYASFSGVRTQQAREYEPPDHVIPKVRTINMVPAEVFWIQYQTCRGIIDHATNLFNIGREKPIYVYYADFTKTAEVLSKLMSEARTTVVGDLKAYDHWVRACEQQADYEVFCEPGPYKDFCAAYSTTAPLIHPWGINERPSHDGRLSGEIPTNIFGGIDNVSDFESCHIKLGIKPPFAYLVNGDDIVMLYDYIVPESQLKKLSTVSYHNMEPDKSAIRSDQSVFYSKRAWWIEGSKGCSAYPISLAINSIAFTERDSSIISAGKEYTYIATGSIVLNVGEAHPYFQQFADKVKELQKYHIRDLDPEKLRQAAEHYAINKFDTEYDRPIEERASEFISKAEAILG